MKPFEDKIANLSRKAFPKYGPWAFLENWSSPINEDNLEELSARGEHDAKVSPTTPVPPFSSFKRPRFYASRFVRHEN